MQFKILRRRHYVNEKRQTASETKDRVKSVTHKHKNDDGSLAVDTVPLCRQIAAGKLNFIDSPWRPIHHQQQHQQQHATATYAE